MSEDRMREVTRHESSSAQSNRMFQLEHQVSILERALLEACKALGSGAPEETARVYKEFASAAFRETK